MRKFTNLVYGPRGAAGTKQETFKTSKFTKQGYLMDMMNFITTEDWNAENPQNKPDDHPKLTFPGVLCIKALKMLISILRRLPADHQQPINFSEFLSGLEKLVSNYPGSGSKKGNCNRHLTYLALKLLKTLVSRFPEVRATLSVKLLQSLGRQIKVFKSAGSHKRVLKLASSLSEHLTQVQRADLFRFSVDLGRDLKMSCYYGEVRRTIFDQPLVFLIQSMEFFRDIQPEQEQLPHLGKLLFEITKQEQLAEKYYETYLRDFFDRMFSSPFFYWSNLRFIIVFIANFKFVWQGLKFNNGFVKSVLRGVNLNPHFLDLVQDKVKIFDEFLCLHEYRQNPEYITEISTVKNVEQVVKRQLEVRIAEIEQLGCEKVHSVIPEDAAPNQAVIAHHEIDELVAPAVVNTGTEESFNPSGTFQENVQTSVARDLENFEHYRASLRTVNNRLGSTDLNKKYLQILRRQV